MGNYYDYKNGNYNCRHCGWSGLGSDTNQGDMWNDGFEIHCPKCHERLPGLIMYPTIEETLGKGEEEDKTAAELLKKLRKK